MARTQTGLFEPSELTDLTGSSAFAERRQIALQSASDLGQPSFEEELWRYTPIDDLDVSEFHLGAPGGAPTGSGLSEGLEKDAAAVIEVVNGEVVACQIHHDLVSVHFDGPLLEDAIASVVPVGADFFTDCNIGYCAAPMLIAIDANAVIESPIVIRQHTTEEQLAWFPRVFVRAGENSEAKVVEHQSSSAIAGLVCPVVEIVLEQAARLQYLTVQEHGPKLWQIATQVAEVGRDARVTLNQVALGGAYARARIDAKMVGQGSSGDIKAVYFGRASAQHDFRTFQKHEAPHTNSNLLFKGAVSDSSRAIYTGLIRIEPEAGDVNAFQTNRTLKLSDEAWAESVPNLEIENNDVKCSHASAVGPIDGEQKFYLESRGVPDEIAEALVVKGFFADVLEDLPLAHVGELINGRIEEFLSLDRQR